MPPRKRTLSTTSPNTTRLPSPKRRKALHSNDSNPSTPQEAFNYDTKFNSKLRILLLDRSLPISGTRAENLALLSATSISYDTIPSAQISQMLKRRHIACAAKGSNKVEIEKLREDDKVDEDRGNYGDGALIGRFEALGRVVRERERVCEDKERYAGTSEKKLMGLLRKRGLAVAGSMKVRVERLRRDDRKVLVSGGR